MSSKLMEVLKLAAKWLQIEGVEGVSANEKKECIEVYISVQFNKKSNVIPNVFHGFNIFFIESV